MASEWKLVWADEFNKDGKPDAKNWVFENGFVRNRELQWYQPQNAFCKDGKLVIEARRVSKPNPNYKPGSRRWQEKRKTIKYTSACLKTRGLHAWKYGRFEVRAKIVAEEGLWPAIWFLGVDGRWPSNGEIDLMEYYDDNILANACWESERIGKPVWDSSRTPVARLGKGWDKEFHIWRMDWDENHIKLYVNDKLLNTIDLSQTKNLGGRGLKNPFHQPHYILLNLAIGGTNGGSTAKTTFPSRYEIDYVRVYQRE